MIIELDLNGARVIVSGENLSISVTEGDIQRGFSPGDDRRMKRTDKIVLDTDSPLKAWRKRAGLRQQDVGESLGVTKAFISQLENGVCSASMELAVKIAELCGEAVPVTSLVRGTA
jgi:putative transcriptional regulator